MAAFYSRKASRSLCEIFDLLHCINTSHILNAIICYFCFSVTNGSYSYMDDDEDAELYGHETEFSSSTQHSYLHERCVVVNDFSYKVAIQSVLHMNEMID